MRRRCNSKALSAYLDGALSARKTRVLERHLKVCARCREDLAGLGRVRDMFKAWQPAAPRAFFVNRVVYRLNQEDVFRFPFWRRWATGRLVPAALAFVSVAALAFLLHRTASAPEPVTVDTYLRRSLDREVLEMTAASESGLSKERVLGFVLASGR